MRTTKLLKQDSKNFKLVYKEARENKLIITNNKEVPFSYLIILPMRIWNFAQVDLEMRFSV